MAKKHSLILVTLQRCQGKQTTFYEFVLSLQINECVCDLHMLTSECALLAVHISTILCSYSPVSYMFVIDSILGGTETIFIAFLMLVSYRACALR